VLERRVDDAAGAQGVAHLAAHVRELGFRQVEDGRARPDAVVGVDVGEVLEQLVADGEPREPVRELAELGRAVGGRDVEARVQEMLGVAPGTAPEVEDARAGGEQPLEALLHLRELHVGRRARESLGVLVVVGEGLGRGRGHVDPLGWFGSIVGDGGVVDCWKWAL